MLNDEEHTLPRLIRAKAPKHRLEHRFRRSSFHHLTGRWNAIHRVHHFECFLFRETDTNSPVDIEGLGQPTGLSVKRMSTRNRRPE